jgi:hypothetical protein
LFDSSFQEAHLEMGVDCYVDFLDEVPSASQIKKDERALYGELLSACQSGVGRRILMEDRDKQDGIHYYVNLCLAEVYSTMIKALTSLFIFL